jgi:ATP-dependent Clp protease ATP-binding subunit ClpA
VIVQKVEDRLSDALLAGEFEDGDAVQVVLEENEIILRRIEKEATELPQAEAIIS